MSKVAVYIINFYQRTISPDHGWLRIFFPHGCCRFRPTCSEYSKIALKKYGLIKGGFLTMSRLFRCHPWSNGGWDPLN